MSKKPSPWGTPPGRRLFSETVKRYSYFRTLPQSALWADCPLLEGAKRRYNIVVPTAPHPAPSAPPSPRGRLFSATPEAVQNLADYTPSVTGLWPVTAPPAQESQRHAGNFPVQTGIKNPPCRISDREEKEALITERPWPSPRWRRTQRRPEWPSRTGSCGSARCRPSSRRS